MKNYYFASTYGSGNYNSSTYNGTTGSSTGTDGSGAGGILTNTGFDVLLAVTLACLIIFVALIARFWHSKPKTAHAQSTDATPKTPSV